MKNDGLKRQLLYMLQDGKDPNTGEVLRAENGVNLHHAVRAETDYWCRRWPKFIHSLLNLQLVAFGAHMNKPKPKPVVVSDGQVDDLEDWLKEHPYESNILNGSISCFDVGKIRKLMRQAWGAVGA